MTDHELIVQMNEKVEHLNQYYNHDLTKWLTTLQTNQDWIKSIIWFVLTLLLAQAVYIIYDKIKSNKTDKIRTVYRKETTKKLDKCIDNIKK